MVLRWVTSKICTSVLRDDAAAGGGVVFLEEASLARALARSAAELVIPERVHVGAVGDMRSGAVAPMRDGVLGRTTDDVVRAIKKG